MPTLQAQRNTGVNKPKLRFPGFDGEWEEERLGEVGKFFSGGTPSSTNTQYYSGTIPFVKSGEISSPKTNQNISKDALQKSSAKKIEKGDLLYALYGATSGSVAISKIEGAINQAILCIRTDGNKNWLFNYLSYQKGRILAKYLQGGQGNLSADIVKNLRILFPTSPEQQKIADFLGSVDKWLANLHAQKESLEAYKKGMMQKIFSQEVRFKRDDGRDFPEWEEKMLGEVCSITTGKLDANAMAENGKYRFYTCAKDYFRINDYVFDTEALLISGNGANVGYINYYKGKFNAYQRTYVLNDFSANVFFLQYFLGRNLKARIKREKKDGNTPYIVLATLKDMPLRIPFKDEQQKIADFLTSLDNIIKSKQHQIAQVEEWKKGLMQGLFV